jgi:ribosome-associated protein
LPPTPPPEDDALSPAPRSRSLTAEDIARLAEEIEATIKRAGGGGPLRTEGLDDLRWVLLDYGDVVVHVFLQEVRDYYELERLWSDVPRQAWEAAG